MADTPQTCDGKPQHQPAPCVSGSVSAGSEAVTTRPESRSQLVPVSRFTRLASAGVCLLIVCVFGIAARLTPNPQGFGTHQQLGLPPCAFRQVLGLSCPACGLTTSFAWLTRFDLPQAFRVNPLGLPLALVLILVAIGAALVSLTGQQLADSRPRRWLIFVLTAFLAGLLAIWLVWAGRILLLFFA